MPQNTPTKDPNCSLTVCSLQITHPAGCMSQFIQFFGEQIMVLWKFALLRKRLLIFSPPPVGVVCYRGKKLKHACTTHAISLSVVLTQIRSLFFFGLGCNKYAKCCNVFCLHGDASFNMHLCSLSVLLLLPGQRVSTWNRCLCA